MIGGAIKDHWKNDTKIECAICGKETTAFGAGRHIVIGHKISSKEYYDTYLRQEGEGICPVCGKEAMFNTLTRGYWVYCSKSCKTKDIIHLNPIVEKKRRAACSISMKRLNADPVHQDKATTGWKHRYNNDKNFRSAHISRITNNSKQHVNGHYYSVKNGQSLHYRSSYEVKAYEILENDSTVESYIVEPFGITYTDAQGDKRTYIPDILITRLDGSCELVEVKPKSLLNDELVKLKIEAGQLYCIEKSMVFSVWDESVLF